jgi:hypothetical protein
VSSPPFIDLESEMQRHAHLIRSKSTETSNKAKGEIIQGHLRRGNYGTITRALQSLGTHEM